MFDNSYNEHELIHLIAQGNEQAFTKLFSHYRNKVYGVALRLTLSTTTATEITEDVFLKIWLRRCTLTEIDNFSGYLFIIVRNETYTILKKKAKNYQMVLLVEDIEVIAQEHSDDNVIAKEYTLLLQKAIDRLPHQQKKVYQLIKEEELDRNEVAEILRIDPETVKFHLTQAMKKIRSFCIPRLYHFIGIPFLSYLIF